MPCQLQYPEDAHDTEHLDDSANVLERLGRGVWRVGLQSEWDVERHDRQHVDEVERALEELPLVRRRPEAHNVLEREPTDADGFDSGQVRVVDNVVLVVMVMQRRQRVESQWNRRDDDE